MGCQSKIPRARTCLRPRIAAFLLALVAACTSNTTPRPIATAPRDLGPETFLGDTTSDALLDLEEEGDLSDASDVVPETGRGQPCRLFLAACDGGLKCTPDPEGNATCQPVPDNPVQVGDVCGQRGLDDCDAGLLCYAPSDSLSQLRCRILCNPEVGEQADGCADESICEGPLAWLQTPAGVCSLASD